MSSPALHGVSLQGLPKSLMPGDFIGSKLRSLDMIHQTAGLGGQPCMKVVQFFVKAVCYEEGIELMFSAFYALRIKVSFHIF
jgi:hypothetical protein